MVKLLDLPTELILPILSYLPRSSLLRLCLTSKVCRSLAQPLLFRHFVATSSDQRPLVYFAHAIARYPGLGLAIQSITATISCAEDMDDLSPPMSDMAEDFRKAIAKIGLPEDRARAWIQDVSDLRLSTLTAFVISQAPNLRSLSIDLQAEADNESGSHTIGELLFVLNPRMAGYEVLPSHSRRYAPKLKKISIKHRKARTRLPLQAYCSLLACEGLESFRGAFITILPDSETPSYIEPNSLSLTKLRLNGCVVNERGINMVLSGCRALQSFTLSAIASSGMDYIPPPNLESALYRHRSNLEYLKVAYVARLPPKIERLRGLKFNDLSSFSCLKRLELNEANMIVDRRRLPPSLEQYRIFNAGMNILHRISDLASSSKPAVFSALKIELAIRAGYDSLYLTAWGRTGDLNVARAGLVEVLRGTKIELCSETTRRKPDALEIVDEYLFVNGQGYRRDSRTYPFCRVTGPQRHS